MLERLLCGVLSEKNGVGAGGIHWCVERGGQLVGTMGEESVEIKAIISIRVW